MIQGQEEHGVLLHGSFSWGRKLTVLLVENGGIVRTIEDGEGKSIFFNWYQCCGSVLVIIKEFSLNLFY